MIVLLLARLEAVKMVVYVLMGSTLTLVTAQELGLLAIFVRQVISFFPSFFVLLSPFSTFECFKILMIVLLLARLEAVKMVVYVLTGSTLTFVTAQELASLEISAKLVSTIFHIPKGRKERKQAGKKERKKETFLRTNI